MKPNDWRYITIKNCHRIIESIADKYPEFTYENIQEPKTWHKFNWTLQQEGISTIQIKDNQLRLVLRELSYHHRPEQQPKTPSYIPGHPDYEPEEEFECHDQNYFESDDDN